MPRDEVQRAIFPLAWLVFIFAEVPSTNSRGHLGRMGGAFSNKGARCLPNAIGQRPVPSPCKCPPAVAPLGPARAPPPVPGARAPKPPKPPFRPSRRPAPSPWGLGAPTSPSERPSEAREPPISPGGPPAAPPAGPFNGHIKRAVGVGRSGRVPLHPWRPGWGGGGRGRAGGGLISLMSREWVI